MREPSSPLANITPSWFGAIMATALIAVAAARLPDQFHGLQGIATGFWVLAGVLLVVLTAATALHWVHHTHSARGHARDPTMTHFYGAPPMAILTFGAATVLVGRNLIGQSAADAADWALWGGGTIAALIAAVAVPYATFTRQTLRTGTPFGGWLLPVVAPMTAAWTGSLLISHAPRGEARADLLLACYAMLGLSLLASLMIITLIWQRLAKHGTIEPRMVPTGGLIVGPLGQTVTTVSLLGSFAHLALPRPFSTALLAAGVVIGVPMMGFAAFWAAIAGAITVRTWRAHLPFSLTWWSFTFAIGACTTGMIGLARTLDLTTLRVMASALLVGFAVVWAIVAVGTVRGVVSGRLLARPSENV